MFMKKLIFTLKTSLVAILATIAIQANAQVVDTVATFDDGDITSDAIVYAKIRLNDLDSTGLGLINSGISLSQNEIVAWADYSAFLRFNNKSNATSNNNIVDVRNGGAFAMGTDTVHFEMGVEYHCWIQVYFDAQTYSAYIQGPADENPKLVFENAAFRFTSPTALTYLSSIHNAGESASTTTILEYKKTDTIGIRPIIVPTYLSKIVDENKPYSILSQNELKINNSKDVKNVYVFDLTGKVVMSAYNLKQNSMNVSTLKQGMYIVKMDLRNGNSIQNKVLKQ
jgi:hypothetical protein